MGGLQLRVSTRSFLACMLSHPASCSLDLTFWYDNAFGSPVARVQGVGYIQELISRLTHTPIATHNSSTNATLHADDRIWPLDDVLYVDATHEVVVLNSMSRSRPMSTLARAAS